MKTEFQSTNKLEFEVAKWHDPAFSLFRVGSCEGMFCATPTSYCIVAIVNNFHGNGHLQDVFDWFENSCKRDKKTLQVVEIMNPRFMKHLIEKRGFKKIVGDNVEKHYKNYGNDLETLQEIDLKNIKRHGISNNL